MEDKTSGSNAGESSEVATTLEVQTMEAGALGYPTIDSKAIVNMIVDQTIKHLPIPMLGEVISSIQKLANLVTGNDPTKVIIEELDNITKHLEGLYDVVMKAVGTKLLYAFWEGCNPNTSPFWK